MKREVGRTDWARVDAMTEEEIVAAANSDPDCPILTEEELKQMKRVHPVKEVNVKKIREKLKLSQEQFAHYFGVSKRTIQEWEQGRCRPSATARNFLRVIEREPKAVQRALSSDKASHDTHSSD